MKMRRFHSRRVDEKELALQSNFVGVLDLPSMSAVIGGEVIVVAGWIMPKIEKSTYVLRIERHGGDAIEVLPNIPRPDVAKKIGASPLAGDSVFNGFRCEVPFSEDVRLFVVMDDQTILWKDLCAIEVHLDAQEALRNILTYGYASGVQGLGWLSVDGDTKRDCVDFELNSVEIIDQDSIGKSSGVLCSERSWFEQFLAELASPDFFSILLTRRNDAGNVVIAGPFSGSQAELIGSFFAGINYLVFDCNGKRFYIGQYLHTADFVYFPDRAISVRVRWSIYDHNHVRTLISNVAEHPALFPAHLIHDRAVELGGVIINGVSPYHFFYDCIPALYFANNRRCLDEINTYYALNGGCYFPLNEIYDIKGRLEVTSSKEMSRICRGLSSEVLIVAGVSYRTLDAESLKKMDSEIIETACLKGATPAVSGMLKDLSEYAPIFWIGISAQKRAWVNQESALSRALTEMFSRYPKMAVAFDGMTSNVFGSSEGRAQFDADRVIVKRICGQLPPNVRIIDLVGCTSAEKLRVAKEADFFIANYSTGSMYPARFYGLPGVAHLSNSLLKAVRDIHIHHDTFVVPAEFVEDIPDPECPRLDFVSYSIDESGFAGFVLDVVRNRLH